MVLIAVKVYSSQYIYFQNVHLEKMCLFLLLL